MGLTTDERSYEGICLWLRWLQENFGVELPADAMESVVYQYVRAYFSMTQYRYVYWQIRKSDSVFLLSLLRDFKEAGSF